MSMTLFEEKQIFSKPYSKDQVDFFIQVENAPNFYLATSYSQNCSIFKNFGSTLGIQVQFEEVISTRC